MSPRSMSRTVRGKVAAAGAFALALLAPAVAHASQGAAAISVEGRPSIAVLSIDGSGFSAAGQLAPGDHENGGRITLGFDGGNGLVTVSRAADIVGQPVDLVSYARMRAAMLARSAAGPGVMPAGSPLSRAFLSSGFGMRRHPLLGGYRAHRGVDLAAPAGTPILAPSDGVVGRAGWAGGYGLLVALEHGKGIQSRYGHMSRLNVSAGQKVRKGDVIGYVGSTGRSTGSHLHYEVRVDGRPVRPDLRQGAK